MRNRHEASINFGRRLNPEPMSWVKRYRFPDRKTPSVIDEGVLIETSVTFSGHLRKTAFVRLLLLDEPSVAKFALAVW